MVYKEEAFKKFEEAQKVKDQFDIAWENADIEITNSIL